MRNGPCSHCSATKSFLLKPDISNLLKPVEAHICAGCGAIELGLSKEKLVSIAEMAAKFPAMIQTVDAGAGPYR